MGSFAISGITHPSDQKFIRLPALVKTHRVEEKLVGRDLEAVRLWREEVSKPFAATEELMRL